MKKLISIILVLSCAFFLFACTEEEAPVPERDIVKETIDEIKTMYDAIAPTKVETVSTISFGEHVLTSTSTLKKGFVDGYAATVYDYSRQEIRSIEEGSNADYLDPIVTIVGGWQYHEDNGYREMDEKTGKFGEWDYPYDDPTPATGANALNITKNTVSNFTVDEENKVVTFTVKIKNSEKVFGVEMESDVSVTIVHSGADITSVSLSYVAEGPDKKNYPEANITITTVYSYEIQEINLG